MAPSTEFPGNVFFYLVLIGFLGFFAWSVAVRAKWFTQTQWVNRFTDPIQRIVGLIPFLLGNSRVARKRYWYSGSLHTMIWLGFLALQIRTLNFLLNGVHEDISFEHNFGVVWDYGLRPTLDVFNILVIVGVGMAAFQRFFWKPKRMTLNWDGWLTLFFIGWLMVTDVFTNSFEIYLFNPENKEWSFLAYGLSEVWREMGMSVGTAEALHVVWWYQHLVDFLAFLCFLPYSKHSHVLTIVPQIFTRRLEPTGVLQPLGDFEKLEHFGVGKLEQFNWKQLLDSYSCTECGRCTDVCPANITGKTLSPKAIIVNMRHLMEEQEPALLPSTKKPEEITPLIDGVGYEPLWDCVTCGACMEECPVFIEHVPTIMDMRRNLVMEESKMPEQAQQTLQQIEQRGHPWRGSQLTRTSWIEEMATEGVEVPVFDGSQEYLYWVGCTGALQERNVKVTQSLVRLLIEAGVSFGVLAAEEGCSGDPARRFGNEYLYQTQAEQNIEIMKSKNVQKVLANCPHCYNTIANEYPQFDGEFEVIHHTVFLDQLLADGKLRPEQVNGLAQKTVTYHDPCYASRHNSIIDEPRRVLTATGVKTVEMQRCKRSTFCCGAGGSHMWMEESQGQRINDHRMEEAVGTGADVIAVACPFCMQMFESSVGAVPEAEERGLQVFDIAELLDQSITYSKPLPPSGNGGGAPQDDETEPEATEAGAGDAKTE
ncbi:MAG: (Fe-S)-binding protein [Chloroflexi bacterium]|nr:(Fe-S)-binding protein [Chloroflexota bacterium]